MSWNNSGLRSIKSISRVHLALWGAAIAAILLIAACGGGGEESPAPAPTQRPPAPTATSATTPPTPTPTSIPVPSSPTPPIPIPTFTPAPSTLPTSTPKPAATPTSPTALPTATPTAIPSTPTPTTAPTENQVSLRAAKDNTLYEDSGGTLSNGSGEHFFVGKNNRGETRRALIAFDISGSVPAGATITSVTLTLSMSRTTAPAGNMSVHKVLADWGEGASDATLNEGGGAAAASGDATWIHRFFNTSLWSAPGGDFSPTPSATTSVAGEGSYTWGSTPEMVADVQGWLNNPSTNFGWLLMGNEREGNSTKRFDSRQIAVEASGPVLVVEFNP